MEKKIYILICIALLTVFSTPSFAGDNDGNFQLDKHKLLRLINDIRLRGCNCGGKYFGPAQPLTWNEELQNAAMEHSMFMKSNNILSHTGENGTNAGQRITATGYSWRAYGENIAVGYTNEEEVVKGWINSPSHCKNIMNNSFKDMGIARSGGYWTQDLAVGK
jgi:uncharacterized protein YkwD